MGRGQGAWPTFFKFLDPLIFLELLKIQTLNLAFKLIIKEPKPNKWKTGQKEARPRSRDLLFKFYDPSNISGMAEDTNLKFCMRIESKGF